MLDYSVCLPALLNSFSELPSPGNHHDKTQPICAHTHTGCTYAPLCVLLETPTSPFFTLPNASFHSGLPFFARLHGAKKNLVELLLSRLVLLRQSLASLELFLPCRWMWRLRGCPSHCVIAMKSKQLLTCLRPILLISRSYLLYTVARAR